MNENACIIVKLNKKQTWNLKREREKKIPSHCLSKRISYEIIFTESTDSCVVIQFLRKHLYFNNSLFYQLSKVFYGRK